MNTLLSMISGLLFGLGLILAGMSNPAKVINFLDPAGAWDPSLALVMGGAITVVIGAFTWAKQRSLSLLGAPMQLPNTRHIDRRLIGGSLLFGIGWGVAGICPGPAVILLSIGLPKAVIFGTAMLAGMLLYEWPLRFTSVRVGRIGAGSNHP